MPGVGLEPTRLTAHDLKSWAATNYAIRAYLQFFHILFQFRIKNKRLRLRKRFYMGEVWAGFEPAIHGFADRGV